jgi:hypothetical protein
MRLRRLAAAEMVRTPAGAWPGRGFGVFPGGSRRAGVPAASTSTARTPPLLVLPAEVPGPSAA